MKKRGIDGDKAFGFANITLLTLILLTMLYPFWYVIIQSFSDPIRLGRMGNPNLLPRGFSLFGYIDLLQYKQFPRYVMNTVIYLTLGTIFRLLISSLAGYVLSVKRFKPGKVIMIAMVFTMFFGGGLIPTYILIRSLGWFNTVWVIVVPGALDVYACIVFKTFFQQLPGELKDAAEIDGANDPMMLFRIIVPVSKPLLATFAIFSIVAYWNDWWSALIYLRKTEMHPIQMLLRNLLVVGEAIKGQANAAGAVRYNAVEAIYKMQVTRSASIVVTTLPIMLIYPFFQKYFTKGIIVGSLKG